MTIHCGIKICKSRYPPLYSYILKKKSYHETRRLRYDYPMTSGQVDGCPMCPDIFIATYYIK